VVARPERWEDVPHVKSGDDLTLGDRAADVMIRWWSSSCRSRYKRPCRSKSRNRSCSRTSSQIRSSGSSPGDAALVRSGLGAAETAAEVGAHLDRWGCRPRPPQWRRRERRPRSGCWGGDGGVVVGPTAEPYRWPVGSVATLWRQSRCEPRRLPPRRQPLSARACRRPLRATTGRRRRRRLRSPTLPASRWTRPPAPGIPPGSCSQCRTVEYRTGGPTRDHAQAAGWNLVAEVIGTDLATGAIGILRVECLARSPRFHVEVRQRRAHIARSGVA
jgi:hypothetical protein